MAKLTRNEKIGIWAVVVILLGLLYTWHFKPFLSQKKTWLNDQAAKIDNSTASVMHQALQSAGKDDVLNWYKMFKSVTPDQAKLIYRHMTNQDANDADRTNAGDLMTKYNVPN